MLVNINNDGPVTISMDSGYFCADPGKMGFCKQKRGFGRRPKISKIYVTVAFERFWRLLNRSWANVLSTTTTTTTNTVLLELLLATATATGYCFSAVADQPKAHWICLLYTSPSPRD